MFKIKEILKKYNNLQFIAVNLTNINVNKYEISLLSSVNKKNKFFESTIEYYEIKNFKDYSNLLLDNDCCLYLLSSNADLSKYFKEKEANINKLEKDRLLIMKLNISHRNFKNEELNDIYISCDIFDENIAEIIKKYLKEMEYVFVTKNEILNYYKYGNDSNTK